jgi:hypothetical protein
MFEGEEVEVSRMDGGRWRVSARGMTAESRVLDEALEQVLGKPSSTRRLQSSFTKLTLEILAWGYSTD